MGKLKLELMVRLFKSYYPENIRLCRVPEDVQSIGDYNSA